MNRALSVLFLIAAGPVGVVRAQATNAERMGEIAVGCVAPQTADADTVTVWGPDRLPFVGTAVVSSWHAAGKTVYDGETGGRGTAVRLAVGNAGVAYGKAGDGMIERTVLLDLLVRVTAPDGRILVDRTCSRSLTDVVDRDLLPSIEDPTWPETVGEPPEPGFLKRVLRPVVIAAATAAGVFLFFSLRSRRADDGG